MLVAAPVWCVQLGQQLTALLLGLIKPAFEPTYNTQHGNDQPLVWSDKLSPAPRAEGNFWCRDVGLTV